MSLFTRDLTLYHNIQYNVVWNRDIHLVYYQIVVHINGTTGKHLSYSPSFKSL